jgi:hypothetical protein
MNDIVLGIVRPTSIALVVLRMSHVMAIYQPQLLLLLVRPHADRQ